MQNNNLAQLELPTVMGQQFEEIPDDLFIPPYALEICLETFSGPLDLLLYLIKKENINILDLDVSKITDQYLEYIELMDSLKFDLVADYLVTYSRSKWQQVEGPLLIRAPLPTFC